MRADVLYNIYETTQKNDAPDLTIGLAMYKAEHPEVEITPEEDKAIRQFIGAHGDVLAKAFAVGPDAFEEAVEACEAEDAARAAACDGDTCDVPGE